LAEIGQKLLKGGRHNLGLIETQPQLCFLEGRLQLLVVKALKHLQELCLSHRENYAELKDP